MTITMIMMVMITMMIDGDDDDYDDNGDDENDDGDINFLPTELVCATNPSSCVSPTACPTRWLVLTKIIMLIIFKVVMMIMLLRYRK